MLYGHKKQGYNFVKSSKGGLASQIVKRSTGNTNKVVTSTVRDAKKRFY